MAACVEVQTFTVDSHSNVTGLRDRDTKSCKASLQRPKDHHLNTSPRSCLLFCLTDFSKNPPSAPCTAGCQHSINSCWGNVKVSKGECFPTYLLQMLAQISFSSRCSGTGSCEPLAFVQSSGVGRRLGGGSVKSVCVGGGNSRAKANQSSCCVWPKEPSMSHTALWGMGHRKQGVQWTNSTGRTEFYSQFIQLTPTSLPILPHPQFPLLRPPPWQNIKLWK